MVKEIETLRKFLFRNQDYRFTKSEQQYIFMAVTTHGNNFLKNRTDAHEDVITNLLDDALKMPFNVFNSSQKDKLLAMYYIVLGEEAKARPEVKNREKTLSLLDVDEGEGFLVLLTDEGEEYPTPVSAPNDAVKEIKKLFDDAKDVLVTFTEKPDSPPEFIKFSVC